MLMVLMVLSGWCTVSLVVGLALGRVFALRNDKPIDADVSWDCVVMASDPHDESVWWPA